MAFKNSFRLWDDDFEQAFWTPEEIAESKAKAARIGEIIDAEQQGFITHDIKLNTGLTKPKLEVLNLLSWLRLRR